MAGADLALEIGVAVPGAHAGAEQQMPLLHTPHSSGAWLNSSSRSAADIVVSAVCCLPGLTTKSSTCAGAQHASRSKSSSKQLSHNAAPISLQATVLQAGSKPPTCLEPSAPVHSLTTGLGRRQQRCQSASARPQLAVGQQRRWLWGIHGSDDPVDHLAGKRMLGATAAAASTG